MYSIRFELERCKKLYDTGILRTDDMFALSVLTEILIRLNYILQELDKSGNRVTFADDIKEGDITDLVNNMRNCVCHSDSVRNKVDTSTLIYNQVRGYCPNFIKVGDLTIGCDYEDDVAFNFGSKVIYYKRHIGRLLKELPDTIACMSN